MLRYYTVKYIIIIVQYSKTNVKLVYNIIIIGYCTIYYSMIQ